MTTTTTEQQRIKLQIEAGYGFYGVRYKKATSKEEKDLEKNSNISQEYYKNDDIDYNKYNEQKEESKTDDEEENERNNKDDKNNGRYKGKHF